ncbi:DUF4192 domain-containing protein [Nakamurella sp. GG22]
MTTTDDAAPIRVSGPAGLLAAVPPMLGFRPTNSLVLICVSGGRRRIGPVARVDLPLGHDKTMAAHLARHALNHADEVVVVCYQDTRRRRPLLDDLLGELATVGVDVMDAMVVRGGRARPALNAAMERAHPGIALPGADHPAVLALNAAGALAGRSVLSDREQLRQSIAGPTGSRLREAAHWITEAAAGRMPSTSPLPAAAAPPGPTRPLTSRPIARGPERSAPEPSYPYGCDGSGPGDLVPPSVRGLMERACHQITTTGAVTVDVAAAIAVTLVQDTVRDAVLRQAVVEVDRPWLPMLISCATRTPTALAPPLCSVLAMVAYRHGDGALAQVAVDRCLEAEPENPLAHTLMAIMSAGLRPELLEDLASNPLGDPGNFDEADELDDGEEL